jgi:hypothetical protein
MGTRWDAGLAKLAVIEDKRLEFGLVGHSERLPNPMRDGLARPVAVSGDPARRMVIKMDDNGRVTDHHTIPYANFKVTIGDNGSAVFSLAAGDVGIDPRDVPKARQIFGRLVREAANRHGVAITADEEERLANECIANLEQFNVDTSVEVPVPRRTDGHLGSILKTAYEAAWYWLGDSWLDDPVALQMNRRLHGDDTATVRANPRQGELRSFDLGELSQRAAHVISLCQSADNLGVIDIQLFDVVGISFIVTEDIASYAVPPNHAVVMDVVADTHYFTSSIDIRAH